MNYTSIFAILLIISLAQFQGNSAETRVKDLTKRFVEVVKPVVVEPVVHVVKPVVVEPAVHVVKPAIIKPVEKVMVVKKPVVVGKRSAIVPKVTDQKITKITKTETKRAVVAAVGVRPFAPIVRRPIVAAPVVGVRPIVPIVRRPVVVAPVVAPIVAPVVRPIVAAPVIRPIVAAPIVRPIVPVRPFVAGPVVRPFRPVVVGK
jgi:hypothetical protein